MQVETFPLVHAHVFDVLPDYCVGKLNFFVCHRELKVALGQIGALNNLVFMSPDEQHRSATRITCDGVKPNINDSECMLLVAIAS